MPLLLEDGKFARGYLQYFLMSSKEVRSAGTKLLHGSEDQAEVVRDALAPLGFTDIPVRPVLCFVGAEWGFFASPFKLGSVLITHPRFLYEVLQREAEVETAAIQETARHLSEVLRRA